MQREYSIFVVLMPVMQFITVLISKS